MKNLKNLILDKVDDESLYILRERFPSLNIDLEWNKRLNSCDSEIYLPTLYFLLENKIKKSQLINSGLYNLRNCFPWRIGIIYDFRYGQVKSVEIRIGENLGRYKFEGKNILFSWLDSDKNKKMLREIISFNSKESLFSTILNNEKSIQVRDLILNNETLSVDVAVINDLTRSFPEENPLRENFIAQPYSISSNLQTIQLIPQTNKTKFVRFEKIPIRFSDDVKTYISTIKY